MNDTGNNMEMKKKLIDWINKTGYPLELFTESLLYKSDYKIINSHIYHDDENKIYRELDLFASKNWSNDNNKVYFDFHLLVECKKSTKPFLLLRNNSIDSDCFSFGEIYGMDDSMSMIFLTGSPKKISMPEKTDYGFKLIQGFSSSDETIHKAINTIIKSYNHFQEKEKEYENDYYKTDNVHSIGIPLLIIDAPFFSMSLNEDSIMELHEIECGILRHISHLNRFEHDPFPIIIVRKDSINTLLKSIDEFGKSFFNYLLSNPRYNINNIDNLEIKLVDKNNV